MNFLAFLLLVLLLLFFVRARKMPHVYALRLPKAASEADIDDLDDLKKQLRQSRITRLSLLSLFIALFPLLLVLLAIIVIYLVVALGQGDYGEVRDLLPLGGAVLLAFMVAYVSRQRRETLKQTIRRLEAKKQTQELAFAERTDVAISDGDLAVLDQSRYRYLGFFAVTLALIGMKYVPPEILANPYKVFSLGFFILGLFIYFLGGIAYRFWLRRYQLQAKTNCLPALARSYGLEYQESGLFAVTELEPHGLKLPTDHIIEDGFSGRLNGRDIRFEEVTAYRTNWFGRFVHYMSGRDSYGVVVRVKLNRTLDFHTLIVKQGGGLQVNVAPKDMKPVNLVSAVFKDKYSVYTTDQTEARYVFDPQFMEQFLSLYEHFRRGEMVISFYGDELVFVIKDNRNQFEFRNAGLFAPANKGSFESVHREIEFYAKIIEVLNLTPERGL